MSSDSTPLTLALVFEARQARQKAAALRVAVELDIFGAIDKGPTTLPRSHPRFYTKISDAFFFH